MEEIEHLDPWCRIQEEEVQKRQQVQRNSLINAWLALRTRILSLQSTEKSSERYS